jgi:ABC-type antimicrobial peptide transport system permease subunit
MGREGRFGSDAICFKPRPLAIVRDLMRILSFSDLQVTHFRFVEDGADRSSTSPRVLMAAAVEVILPAPAVILPGTPTVIPTWQPFPSPAPTIP